MVVDEMVVDGQGVQAEKGISLDLPVTDLAPFRLLVSGRFFARFHSCKRHLGAYHENFNHHSVAGRYDGRDGRQHQSRAVRAARFQLWCSTKPFAADVQNWSVCIDVPGLSAEHWQPFIDASLFEFEFSRKKNTATIFASILWAAKSITGH